VIGDEWGRKRESPGALIAPGLMSVLQKQVVCSDSCAVMYLVFRMKGVYFIYMKKDNPINRKQILRQTDHMTTPPRMEGKAKNAGMNPVHKQKKGGK